MIIKKLKSMPFVMTILSALYFLYVVFSEDTVLMADTVGGDPGGKVLPLVISIFMFLGFLYLSLKEQVIIQQEDNEISRLFFITLIFSLGYVFLIRYIGFIILSSILIFSLEYIYNTLDEKWNWRKFLASCSVNTILTVVCYIIMRIFTRNLMLLSRVGVIPYIFGVKAFLALFSLMYVVIITVLLYKTVYKRLKINGEEKIANAALLTVATVLFLYVIFKQFFSVNLAVGLLDF